MIMVRETEQPPCPLTIFCFRSFIRRGRIQFFSPSLADPVFPLTHFWPTSRKQPMDQLDLSTQDVHRHTVFYLYISPVILEWLDCRTMSIRRDVIPPKVWLQFLLISKITAGSFGPAVSVYIPICIPKVCWWLCSCFISRSRLNDRICLSRSCSMTV